MKTLSVTEIIRKSGVGPDYDSVPEAYLNAKAQLGKEVHSLCQMAATGLMKLPNSDAGLLARSFVEWVHDSEAKIIDMEFRVKGSVNGTPYVGHPDLLFEWNRLTWLADIKTTAALYSSYGIQLAAYRHAMPVSMRIHRRAVLWLRKDSPAKLVCEEPIIRPSDHAMWRALVISQTWMRGAKL